MLTDIDISSYDDDTLGTPSVTSFRLNKDVLCIQPASLRNADSFRSTKDVNSGAIKRNNYPALEAAPPPPIKFRGMHLYEHTF